LNHLLRGKKSGGPYAGEANEEAEEYYIYK
jgi:hypothetical protein